MKSLSIHQPFAWLIVQGTKDIENRTWSTRYRGPLLIHAGRRVETDIMAQVIEESKRAQEQAGFSPTTPMFNIGGIIGIADLVDIVTTSHSEWFNGPYGWVLANARPLEFYPCAGKLGIFDVTYPHQLDAATQESWLYSFTK